MKEEELEDEEKTVQLIMVSLSKLTPPQFATMTNSLHHQTLHHHHRLTSMLSSPLLFSLSLNRLESLSLQHKTLLISKHLLSSLHHLTLHFQHPPPPPCTTLRSRDLDAALLLLFLCEVHHENPDILKTPLAQWREVLRYKYCSHTMLSNKGLGVYYGGVVLPYIEMVIRCWRFVRAMVGSGVTERREVGAAPATVVALPSKVVARGGGGECLICKEEMSEGRDVCELPCEHLFHWICILQWFKERSSCPCCRFQLPSEDVHGEIQRLWCIVMAKGGRAGSHGVGQSCT